MKIPVETRQVARPGSTNAPMYSVEAAGIKAGANAKAFGMLADESAALADEIRVARLRSEVTNRLATAQKEFSDFWIERSTRPDEFKTLGEDTQKIMTEISSRATAGLDDVEAQTLLSERLQDFALDKQMNADATARRQELEYSDKQMRLAMENSRTVMSNTNDPLEAERIRIEIRAGLDAQIAAGVYSTPDAEALWSDFVSGTQSDAMEKLVYTDPYKASRLLHSDEPIEGLDFGARAQFIRAADAEINRRVAEHERAIYKEVKSAVADMEHGIRPKNLDAVMKAAAGTQYEEMLGTNKEILDASTEFAALDLDEQARYLEQVADEEPGSADEVRFRERIEKIHAAQAKQLKEDPAGLAIKKGLVRDQAPLDFSGPDALSASLQDMRINYDIQLKHFGESAAPLRGSDVTALQRFLSTASAPEQASVLGLMASELDTAMPAAMRQIYDKGNVLPALAGQVIAEGDEHAASMILAGQKTIEQNKAILPTGDDFKAGIMSRLGGAYAASPQHWAAISEGVRAAYAGLSQLEGDTTGILSDDRLDRAVTSVTGGLVEYGDQLLQPPERGVDSDRFATWIDNLRPFDLDRMGGVAGYEDKAALEMIRDRLESGKARLVSVGNGEYEVYTIGLNDRPEPLLNHDGGKFRLNWAVKATHHQTVGAE